jgi:hypothetical protein
MRAALQQLEAKINQPWATAPGHYLFFFDLID